MVACTPASCCCRCGGEVVANASPTFRHQVLSCLCCRWTLLNTGYFTVIASTAMLLARGELPKTAPSGQMGPRLMSYISVLGEYHLSIRKSRRFASSVRHPHHLLSGLSLRRRGRISSLLTPTHHALKGIFRRQKVIHADETSHQPQW